MSLFKKSYNPENVNIHYDTFDFADNTTQTLEKIKQSIIYWREKLLLHPNNLYVIKYKQYYNNITTSLAPMSISYTDWSYRQFTIHIHQPFFDKVIDVDREREQDIIQRCILHELLHSLLAELYMFSWNRIEEGKDRRFLSDLNETITQDLTNILMKMKD